jgi:hypothetical protein
LRSPRLPKPSKFAVSQTSSISPYLHHYTTRFFYLILLHPPSSNSRQFQHSPYLRLWLRSLLQNILEVHSLLAALYTSILHTIIDFLYIYRFINSIDYCIVRLYQHRDKYLHFLTNRYFIFEITKGSK